MKKNRGYQNNSSEMLHRQMHDVKSAGKADLYYEKYVRYWRLKSLVSTFKIVDYTKKIIGNPDLFHANYMIQKGSKKARLAKLIANYAYLSCPTYICYKTRMIHFLR